jgi:Family of unknown function (DUF5317)
VLLVAVVILSVVTVRAAGGSLAALGRVRVRYAPAIFGALAIQIAIISVVPGGSPGLHRVLYIGSYALAAVFVVANRRLAGMRMLALGATLNLIAILANNGVMPASRSALRTAGILSRSTDFLNSASVAHPRLLFLGDIFAVPRSVPLANVYSIGDVCIAIGVAIAIHGLAGSRLVPRRAGAPGRLTTRRSRASVNGRPVGTTRRGFPRDQGRELVRRRGRSRPRCGSELPPR